MSASLVLEIAADCLEVVVAAESGGASRIELCFDLAVGGLTPSSELAFAVRRSTRLPIFSMIRPRAGDFVYSSAEFETMKREINTARERRMDGVVLGILHADGRIDIERTRQLVGLASPLPVTFHRAFDAAPDALAALDAVMHTGAARILTSGGAATALEGLLVLEKLVETAHGQVIILTGGGINSSNIRRVAAGLRSYEFHSGLTKVMRESNRDLSLVSQEVRDMLQALRKSQNSASK